MGDLSGKEKVRDAGTGIVRKSGQPVARRADQ